MSFANIPDELKALPQWCCWRWEDIGAKKPNKPPYNPITRQFASVSDPSTWATFEQVINNKFSTQIWNENDDIKTTGYTGIGFILSENDPYALIDLDSTEGDQIAHRRQIEIFREFDSYSELSPSGMGLHIIVRGSVLAGRKRSYLEIYSSRRYATFTGNAYPKDQPKPIRDCQDKLMQLWQQMGDGPVAHTMYQGDEREKFNDQEIIKQASSAANSDKFNALWSGNWNTEYPSQSEADFALIDILAFYTQNRNQIGRLFRSSKLGARDKANRTDYLSWMINKSFDRMLPPIDFDGFKNNLELKLAQQHQLELKLAQGKPQSIIIEPTLPGIAPAPISIPQPSTVQLPPGLLGELASFIYAAAPRPVPEIALAGAIGLMAGIVGRAYNINGTGLNQYVLLLARTGRGKESMASGIDKLMNEVRKTVPTSARFRGPGVINSGQALIKHLSASSNCFVSVLGEFGMTIERISAPNANSADKMLYQMLFDLYNKSGYGQTMQPSIYSKKEDNTNIVESPAVTILGESNPKVFYDILNEGMIAKGLLPRFLIIEYSGSRVSSNDNHHLVQPSWDLSEKFGSLIAYVETILNNKNPNAKKVIDIGYDEKAFKMLKQFDLYADDKINSSNDDSMIEELWNRAHMKALRLSGLIAVGVNYLNPVVLPEHAEWSLKIVQNDIKALSSKFESGEVGTNTAEIKQLKEMTRIIKEYVIKDWEHVSKYIPDLQKMHVRKIIPYLYLSKRLANNVAFKIDRIGSTMAMKRTIQVLIDRDSVREVSKKDAGEEFGTSQKCYVITNVNIMDD